MNDRAVELLEQYDIEVLRTRKGRGTLICDTDQGSLVLKEYTGNSERIELQNRLLQAIEAGGAVQAERIIPTREGSLLAREGDGTAYVLKTWRDGRECNIQDRGECVQAVRLLAKLHGYLELPADTPGLPAAFSPEKEYEKHNREIRRVRKFLKQKGQKQQFEISLLGACDYFLEQALEVTEDWKQYSAAFRKEQERAETITFCHGDYQYHNILMGTEGWFIVNFEKCLSDDPVRDLYLLLRKLLEKGNWSVALGKELLKAYERERPVPARSRVDLYYRLAYPEKFWKIVNFYYNSGKAWIPGKNQEKLEKLIAQEKEKQRFLEEVFREL
ncbi:MAG: CotS family spore coat protein [Roseburia sp.]|nr:CotS family spore coat protein [Roseburia sp.]MCM1096692.1 CotS family spore coat protein [Ruminococcus flavefaciens]